MIVFIALDDGLYFLELHEFVHGFEGNLGLILDGLEVHHFIHVVRGHRSHDALMLLVVPDFLVLLEVALVHLVEDGEWSRFVHFLPLLVLFRVFVVMVLLFANLDVMDGSLLLLGVVVTGDVDAVGVMLGRFIILWL